MKRRRSLSGPIALLSLLTWSGCNAIMGYEEGESTAGTATGAGGGTGTGTVSPPVEDCLNHADEDDNGLVDCADPACATDYLCAELPPANWIGVGWLYEAPSPGLCPEGQSIELFDEVDFVAPAATCACSCDPPTTTSCAATVACSYFSCGATSSGDGGTATDECSPFELNSAGQDCDVQSLQAIAGPCSPASTLTAPDPQWPAAASLCVHDEGGHCPGQATCVPRDTAAQRGPCVARHGEHACPAEYPEQQMFWDGTVNDGRGCGDATCACGATSSAVCECTGQPCGVRGYYSASCVGDTGLAAMDGSTCFSFGPLSPPTPPWSVGMRIEGATVTDPGSCQPAGVAQPLGEVTPAAAITVCCSSSSPQ